MHFGFIVELVLEMFTEPSHRYVGASLAGDKKELRRIYFSYIFAILMFSLFGGAMGYATYTSNEEPFYTITGFIVTIIFVIFTFVKIKRFISFIITVKKHEQIK